MLCDRRTFDILLFPSAPLSRLTPIEALPQTPQWVSPLDPDQGRAPGPFARFARWAFYFVLATFSVRLCHSSLLTPHSSLKPRSSLCSHRIPIPIQQSYNFLIIKSLYSMIICTLRIGINSHGASMAYLLKRILHHCHH